MNDALAAAPPSATQPVAELDDSAMAIGPATAPSTTQPVAEMTDDSQAVKEESAIAIAEPATAPSTQPVAQDDRATTTVVTELPMEELPAVNDAAD